MSAWVKTGHGQRRNTTSGLPPEADFGSSKEASWCARLAWLPMQLPGKQNNRRVIAAAPKVTLN
jgi:hypothetical protein